MSLDDELAALGVGDTTGPALPPPPEPVLKAADANTVHPSAAQWAKWRDRFAEAMDGSFHTIGGLEQMIFQGRAQLWPGRAAAMVTEIVSYAGGEKAIQGLWAAGDVGELLEMAAGIEAYGRLMGCTSALIEGRAGWTKSLKAIGYRPWSVTLRKGL